MQSKNSKLAKLLTLLPEEESKLLVEQLSVTEKKQLSNELSHLQPLTITEKTELLDEVHSLLFHTTPTPIGKLKQTLTRENQPDELAKFISEEKPATTALLLSFLPVKKAAHLFRHMSRGQREAVFESLIELSNTKMKFQDSLRNTVKKKWGAHSNDCVNENAQALIETIMHTLPKLHLDPLISKFAHSSKNSKQPLLGS